MIKFIQPDKSQKMLKPAYFVIQKYKCDYSGLNGCSAFFLLRKRVTLYGYITYRISLSGHWILNIIIFNFALQFT